MQNGINHIKKWIEENSEAILMVLLLVFFVTEAISKVMWMGIREKLALQAEFKTIVLGLVVLGLFLYKKREILYILILSVIFCIGQFTIPDGFELPTVSFFLKYIFPIAFFGFFIVQPRKPKLKLLKVFEYLLLFNSLIILIGWIFDIQYFRTYLGNRFGFNGLMVSSATSTYGYIIGMFYFLARYQKEVIKNWKFWLTVIGGLLVGTKSIVLTLAFLCFYYVMKYVKPKIYRWGLVALVVFGALGFAFYLFFINPIFQSIRETDGLLTSFLSLRDQLLVERTLPYIQENWDFWNYLFGGVSNFNLRPQLELVDIIFFWGILGSFCYLYFYLKSFLAFEYRKSLIYFYLVILLIITFLAGNFFYNASVVIYMVILRESLVLYNYKSQLN